MTGISRRARAAMFVRSFLIQGSWNYRTMIGAGFAFSLIPALREIFGDDPDELDAAVERHSGIFNSHPYLATIAIGAVATLEAERLERRGVDRFKDAVRGSLGTLGDRLVWTGWRPLCLLGALAALVAGAPWWGAVLGFLVVYNAGQIALRLWGFRIGVSDPRRIGEHLRRPMLERLQRVIAVLSVFLIGALVPMVASGMQMRAWADLFAFPPGLGWPLAGMAGAILGAYLGRRARELVVPALAGFTLFVLIVGLIR